MEVLGEHGQVRLRRALVVLRVWRLLHHLLDLLDHLSDIKKTHTRSNTVFCIKRKQVCHSAAFIAVYTWIFTASNCLFVASAKILAPLPEFYVNGKIKVSVVLFDDEAVFPGSYFGSISIILFVVHPSENYFRSSQDLEKLLREQHLD